MRSALAAFLFALPMLASAQPVAGSAYISPEVGFGYGSGGGVVRAGALVGYQLTDHVDVGVDVSLGDHTFDGVTPFALIQPRVGLRTLLGAGVEAEAALAVSAFASDIGPEAFGLRTLGAQADVRLSRAFPVVGSLKLAPTVGGYATTCTTLNLEPAEGLRCAEAGALLGAELRFRVFGLDAAMPLVVPVRLVGDTRRGHLGAFGLQRTPPRAGLRITF